MEIEVYMCEVKTLYIYIYIYIYTQKKNILGNIIAI